MIVNFFKKIKDNLLQEIIMIFLALYLSFINVWDFYYFHKFAFLSLFILFYIVIRIFFPKLVNYELKENNEKFSKKEFLIYGLVLLLVFAFSLIAWYPANTNPDTITQWNQVLTNDYGNWHPIIQTIFTFKIPSLIYKDFISCSIFQIIFIGSIMLYFCYFLRKYFFSKKTTILILLIMILNPSFMKMSVGLIKDVPFSWCIFLGTLLLIEIVITKGKWLDNFKHKILLVITSLGILLLRHNGIVCILCMFIYLIIIATNKNRRKVYTYIFISLLCLRFILYNVTYPLLNIPADSGKVDLMGVAMSQISYIYHKNVEMTNEEKTLLDKFAPKEVWDKNYHPANFNNIRFSEEANMLYATWINENFNDIMKLYFKNLVRHPIMYLTAQLNVTNSIWIMKDDSNYFWFDIPDETNSSIILKTRGYYNSYTEYVMSSPFKYIFFGVGTSLFIIILSILIIISKKGFQWYYFAPYTIVISNTILILFVISGAYEFRYVYSQLICALPLLIYSLSLKNKKIENINN